MNVIFLTLVGISDISVLGITTSLIRKFRDEGHKVYVVSPLERRERKNTHIIKTEGVTILKVHTLNIKKAKLLEKGIGTLLIEEQYKWAIKAHFEGVVFDLILYSTPPITFTSVVRFLKGKNPQATSYLLLKDIFPQNAVDIGIFSEKSLFWWYFRRKEKALYKASDFIGCMSPENVNYVREHNAFYPADHLDVAPNSIQLSIDHSCVINHIEVRGKYGLPTDKPIFIYGGNLGKPQGIDYIIRCMEINRDRDDCFFLIIGSGTEYVRLRTWYEDQKPHSVRLMSSLPKEEYMELTRCCDVGMIFLDHRFTIPNYPSRLLSYMENKIPIICTTDVHTDVGRIAEQNGYGYWCESVRPDDFTVLVDKMLSSDRKQMGERGYQFLMSHYLVEHTYQTIVKHL